jgi:hypothetical protein
MMTGASLSGAGVGPGEFRDRGRAGSRLESFSDAVFAFTLALLVVSMEVPRSFAQLKETMSGFVAFAACFAILLWIWYEHYSFFRRYGLHDTVTIALNGLLLFVVLFYVYPLKFMFSLLALLFFGIGSFEALGGGPVIAWGDTRQLMVIYGLGFLAVFTVFALLYARALALRAALDLTELEVFDTRTAMRAHVYSAAVGVAAILLALVLPQPYTGVSGFLYAALGPVHAVHGIRTGRRREHLEARLAARAAKAQT